MTLSPYTCKKAAPKDTLRKLEDGQGLALEIHPNGEKHWSMKYSVNKKKYVVAFGSYPAVSLKQAREKKLEVNALLAEGVTP